MLSPSKVNDQTEIFMHEMRPIWAHINNKLAAFGQNISALPQFKNCEIKLLQNRRSIIIIKKRFMQKSKPILAVGFSFWSGHEDPEQHLDDPRYKLLEYMHVSENDKDALLSAVEEQLQILVKSIDNKHKLAEFKTHRSHGDINVETFPLFNKSDSNVINVN